MRNRLATMTKGLQGTQHHHAPADDKVLPHTNVEKDLIQTPSLAEVTKAIIALKTQRAYGVDDILAEFYHVHWHAKPCIPHLFCMDLQRVCDDWLCGECL